MAAKKVSAAIEAARLLGKWTKLAQGHVMFGAGCSCGIGVGLGLADFEPQILDYLETRHGVGGFAGVPELLRWIAKEGDGKKESLALLADLSRSLESFDELHRGRQA
jgi:hypothetical protein